MNGAANGLKGNDLVSAPTHGQIGEHLAMILASQSFSRAPSLGRLLEYTVRSTLEGHADHLKEYELGVSVFDRGSEFDPRVDTIVRVQARKLRKRLEDYYSSEGSDADVRILLPKGSYVPAFQARAERDEHEGSERTEPGSEGTGCHVVVIVAVCCALASLAGVGVGYGLGARSSRRSNGVRVALNKIELINPLPGTAVIAAKLRSVLDREMKSAAMVPVTGPSDTGLALTGAVELRGSRVRMTFRLRSAQHNTFVWSGTYEGEADQSAFVELVGRKVASGAKEGIAGFECVHIY